MCSLCIRSGFIVEIKYLVVEMSRERTCTVNEYFETGKFLVSAAVTTSCQTTLAGAAIGRTVLIAVTSKWIACTCPSSSVDTFAFISLWRGTVGRNCASAMVVVTVTAYAFSYK